jgi:hypothetical protein
MPAAYDSEQSVPQLIPAGSLAIVPLPRPLLETDRSAEGGGGGGGGGEVGDPPITSVIVCENSRTGHCPAKKQGSSIPPTWTKYVPGSSWKLCVQDVSVSFGTSNATTFSLKK